MPSRMAQSYSSKILRMSGSLLEEAARKLFMLDSEDTRLIMSLHEKRNPSRLYLAS